MLLWDFDPADSRLRRSAKALTPEHEQQLLNYMHITRKAVGYLVNFRTKDSVEWKRYVLSEYIPKDHQA